MVPSLQSELRAMRAALERLASESASPDTAASLGEVVRSLRRLERSAPAVLPFLRAENAAARALLAELAPSLPEPITAAVEPGAEPADDLDRVNDANGRLRTLLSDAIAALPDDPTGTAACARIRDHLLTTARQRPW